MRLSRPDLDDYHHLAHVFAGMGLMALWFSLRGAAPVGTLLAMIAGGVLVGGLFVALLVWQISHEQMTVAHEVDEEGDPALPVAWLLTVVAFLVVLVVGIAILSTVQWSPLYRGFTGNTADTPFMAGALLPWILLVWPLNGILQASRQVHHYIEDGDKEDAEGDQDQD